MDTVGGWIGEERYFYINLVLRPLSPNAQALWHYLMYRANGAFWQFPIYLRTAEIIGAVGLSRSSFIRARQELLDSEYICCSEKRGKPTGYALMSNIRYGCLMQPRRKREE